MRCDVGKLAAAVAAAVTLAGALCAAGPERIGRPVRIVSVGFHNQPLEAIRDVVDAEAAKGVDLVILPETWRGQNATSMETLDGAAVTAMAAMARKHHTYVVCPIDRRQGDHRLNSAVLIDRGGKVAMVYDKAYPYWPEFDLKPGVEAGARAPVYETDFGRVGLAICFDVNFPEVWQRLAEGGAELVVWPSAYSGGSALQAHALNHHYYIVTATGRADCTVYDITGEQLLYQKSKDINIARITLDLDRGIYHQNFNIARRDRLLKEHAGEVLQEVYLQREEWFVLRAQKPGVSARALAQQYGLEELRAYQVRSRLGIDKKRGSGLQ